MEPGVKVITCQLYICNSKKKKENDHAGTWTQNLLIRSQAPYPIGPRGLSRHPSKFDISISNKFKALDTNLGKDNGMVPLFFFSLPLLLKNLIMSRWRNQKEDVKEGEKKIAFLLKEKKNAIDHAGTWTQNLLIRSQAPYPIGPRGQVVTNGEVCLF